MNSIEAATMVGAAVAISTVGACLTHACESPVVEAQSSEWTEAHQELALALAKTTVNEAGWNSPNDMDLIWMTVSRRGRTPERRLAWLKNHSSCVNGEAEPEERQGNCEWTRDLRWDDTMPEAFPFPRLWESHYVPRWTVVRRAAERRVRRNAGRRVCSEYPDTWGGRMDHVRALRLGMRPLDCEGTLNEGFKYE